VKVQPLAVSASEFLPDKKGSKTQTSPQRAYEELRVNQRDAIDRVIEDARRNERDQFAEWKLAFVKANKAVIPGTFGPYKAWETTDIRLILKRAPRTTPQGSISSLSQYGRIIDTSEPQYNWSQQQQMMSEQPQQKMPPPPPNMMGPGGQQIPFPPMQPPPGAGRGPAPQIIGGGGANKKGGEKDKFDKKSHKGPSRNSSPGPTPIRKETKTVKEKVTEWDAGGGRRNNSDDSDSDDSSIQAVYDKNDRRKSSKTKLHGDPIYTTKYGLPRPPIGKDSHKYMSGGNYNRHFSGSPPPSLRRKSSIKETRRTSHPQAQLNGQRLVEKRTIERYVDSDDSSDRSYVHVNRRGSDIWSERGSDYTDPSSLGSRDSRQDRDYRRDTGGRSYDAQYRTRSRSRSRPRHWDSRARSPRSRNDRRSSYIRDEKRLSFESRDSRDSRDGYRIQKRRDAYRQHGKPDAYRGISPVSSTSSQSSREQPLPVHVHIHQPDPTVAITKQTLQGLPLRGPSSPTRSSNIRGLGYDNDPGYAPWLNTLAATTPRAPTAPTYEDSLYEQRQREDAARLHVESQRRRSLFERNREDEALVRAREERENWERRRTLDNLKREEVRKKREIDDLSREAERKREEIRRRGGSRYDSVYGERDRERYASSDYRDRW
jgi:hypothetical protein